MMSTAESQEESVKETPPDALTLTDWARDNLDDAECAALSAAGIATWQHIYVNYVCPIDTVWADEASRQTLEDFKVDAPGLKPLHYRDILRTAARKNPNPPRLLTDPKVTTVTAVTGPLTTVRPPGVCTCQTGL